MLTARTGLGETSMVRSCPPENRSPGGATDGSTCPHYRSGHRPEEPPAHSTPAHAALSGATTPGRVSAAVPPAISGIAVHAALRIEGEQNAASFSSPFGSVARAGFSAGAGVPQATETGFSPPYGERGALASVVDAAYTLLRTRREEYSFAGAPRSENPSLTGNRAPGSTVLAWLHRRNKCNQFVGDALYAAGYSMPTFRMSDGSRHYVHAEALLQRSSELRSLRSLADVRPGHLIVIDYPGNGEDSAHVEIVTAVSTAAATPLLHTIGAHHDGVELRDRTPLLQSLLTGRRASARQSERVTFLEPLVRRWK